MAAARKLIAAHEADRKAADDRIRIAERQIETWKEKGALETLRAKELENVIAAEREQIKILLGKIELQEKRVKKLEGQLSRSRKLALITTVAAAVGIVIAVAK